MFGFRVGRRKIENVAGKSLSLPEYLNPTPVLPDSPFKNGNPNREIRAKKRKQSGEIKKIKSATAGAVI